jgi:hypothetical protein
MLEHPDHFPAEHFSPDHEPRVPTSDNYQKIMKIDKWVGETFMQYGGELPTLAVDASPVETGEDVADISEPAISPDFLKVNTPDNTSDLSGAEKDQKLSEITRERTVPTPDQTQAVNVYIEAPQATLQTETLVEGGAIAATELVKRLETDHFVKEAPVFIDQAEDTSRTNTFKYVAGFRSEGRRARGDSAHVRQVTEHEGLQELKQFLEDIPKHTDYEVYRAQAKGMLENLTYIGEKEYQEAIKGIAAYWKDFLDKNENNQLCVLTKVTDARGKVKSDMYLFERILELFSEDEIERYGDRLITELDQITALPEDTKIVLLDDWTISGSQMQKAYASLKTSEKFERYADKVEINLIAASDVRLHEGLREANGLNGARHIPVKAYYKAHAAPETSEYSHKAHITGTHSAVDGDFEIPVSEMIKDINDRLMLKGRGSERLHMPACTNIVRTYRDAELPRSAMLRSRRRPHVSESNDVETEDPIIKPVTPLAA